MVGRVAHTTKRLARVVAQLPESSQKAGNSWRFQCDDKYSIQLSSGE
jgi:hypothetical protein